MQTISFPDDCRGFFYKFISLGKRFQCITSPLFGNNALMREIGKTLDGAKQKVQNLMGIPVLIKINSGRGKSALVRGEVTAVFPAVFSVRLEDGELRTFSYADVQTHGVMFVQPLK